MLKDVISVISIEVFIPSRSAYWILRLYLCALQCLIQLPLSLWRNGWLISSCFWSWVVTYTLPTHLPVRCFPKYALLIWVYSVKISTFIYQLRVIGVARNKFNSTVKNAPEDNTGLTELVKHSGRGADLVPLRKLTFLFFWFLLPCFTSLA